MNKRLLALCPLLVLAGLIPVAAQPPAANPEGAVVISGTVPDQASRAAILAKLTTLYGDVRIVDALEVGGVVPPPNWTSHVTALLEPGIRQVRAGQLQVSGTRVALHGKVSNEAQRQQIASTAAAALTPAYTVINALSVSADEQAVLNQTLGDRVVEFDSGSATLTAAGARILDEMAASIIRLDVGRVQIVGHTDSHGNRLANIGLSLERANAVRAYLQSRGIDAERMSALGAGPDQPVADNDTAQGRARNRRIEFRTSG